MYAAQSRRWDIVSACAGALVELEHLGVKLTAAVSTLFLIRLLRLHLDWMWGVRQFLIAIETCAQFLVLRSITNSTIPVDSDSNSFFAFVPRFTIWATYRAPVPCISIYTVSKTTSNFCPTGLHIAHLCSWGYRRSESIGWLCSAACTALRDQFTIWPDFNLPFFALNHQPWRVLLLSLSAYWNDSLCNWLFEATAILFRWIHNLLI